MTKFRKKLLLALVTLIIAVLICLGILIGQLFKNYYLKVFDERLKQESELISHYVTDQGGLETLSQNKIEAFSDTLNVSVTVADTEGNIIFDSSKDGQVARHVETIYEIAKEHKKDRDFLEIRDGFALHYYWKPIVLNAEQQGFIILSTEMTEVEQGYKQIWWVLIIGLGIALLIILFLGTRIMTRYTKPIDSATKVAIELAKGNYRARTYEDPLDETSMLSNAINILARNLQEMVQSQEIQKDRLETLIEHMGSGLILIDSRGYVSLINQTFKQIFDNSSKSYLQKLYYEVIDNETLTGMIEEIFMTEQKVRRQLLIPVGIERRHFDVYGVPIIGKNDVWKGVLLVFHDITELKKLEQMRKDFVANVSHELKTPITSIKGFSETLLDGAMEDKQALSDFLKIILQESDRLQSLVQDLLDLSKIEQHGFSLSMQQFDIVITIKEVFAIMKGRAQEKEIDLFLEREEGEILISGDPHRIKQVFLNLLSNAISYTPIGGRVSVVIKSTRSNIIVKVSDTGIGMEAEEIPRIFERFYRVDKARSRNSGGTGLGLAIVKHITEAHKGNITVKSTIGTGTVFTIKLPKKN